MSQLNTRIQNKCDYEYKWLGATTFIPKKGELIVYLAEADEEGNIYEGVEIPANRKNGNDTYPYKHPRVKIGDGLTQVNDLPFVKESLSDFVVEVPQQSNTLVYTGEPQEPTWTGYNPEYMYMFNTTQGVDAGEYITSFGLTGNAIWTDGTSGVKQVKWSIQKASATLSATITSQAGATDNVSFCTIRNIPAVIKLSVKLMADGKDYPFDINKLTVSYEKPASLSITRAESSLTCYAGTEEQQNQLLTLQYEDANINTNPYHLTFNNYVVGDRLHDCSWATIQYAASKNIGQNYWEVGDTKNFNLKGAFGTYSGTGDNRVGACIMGFNHTNGEQGVDQGIHFCLGAVLLTNGSVTQTCFCSANYGSYTTTNNTSYFVMQPSTAVGGGWSKSHMRNNILGSSAETVETAPEGSLLKLLPDTLCKVLSKMTKYTYEGGSPSSSQVGSTEDYLPLLSEYEIFGQAGYASSYEKTYCTLYDFYSNANVKTRYDYSNRSSTRIWWTRTPSPFSIYNWIYVPAGNATGGYTNYPYYIYGVAPLFKIS